MLHHNIKDLHEHETQRERRMMRDNDDKCANCACAFFNSSYEGNCQGEINGGPAIISCKEFEPEYSQHMTSPYRPPSCDLPPEHYDEYKGINPCPICGHDKVGWGAGDIYINEFKNDEVAVQCDRCGVQINDRTYRKSKGAAVKAWNSIPRRSEVAELLRLVEETIMPPPTPAEERLQTYANKLRKEWKL